MDFLERFVEYLRGLPFMPPNIDVGIYNENVNSIAVRPIVSNISERYVEKSKIYPQTLQILVHNKSNLVAYQTSQQLLGELDMLDDRMIVSGNDSFQLVSLKCTTTPNFIQKTGYGYLWSAIYEAEIFVKE